MGRTIDTAAASDLHLGSKRSHVKVLRHIWETLYHHSPPRQFVIVGDFFDDIDDITDTDGSFSEEKFMKLPKSHLTFLKFLADVHREGVSAVIAIEGNHDRNKSKRLIRLHTPLMPYPLVESHAWGLAGEKWLAVHGHTLDPEWLHKRWVPELANKAFRAAIQRFDGDDGHFSRWVDERVTTHRRKYLRKILQPALAAYAVTAGANHVIGGHSHDPVRSERHRFDGTTVISHNCGCWVNRECSWIRINAAGGVHLHMVDA